MKQRSSKTLSKGAGYSHKTYISELHDSLTNEYPELDATAL